MSDKGRMVITKVCPDMAGELACSPFQITPLFLVFPILQSAVIDRDFSKSLNEWFPD